jgi:hypothetical protein
MDSALYPGLAAGIGPGMTASALVVGPFGYCSDALGDLVRAALTVATSGWRAEVSFDGEPREWRLVIGPYWDRARSDWTDFRLRVLAFPSVRLPPVPEEERKTLFEAPCSADAFIHSVLKAAQAVWDEHGGDGYDKLWVAHVDFHFAHSAH